MELTDRQTDVVLCNDLQIIVCGEYNVNQEQKVPGFLHRNLSHYEYMQLHVPTILGKFKPLYFKNFMKSKILKFFLILQMISSSVLITNSA